MKTFMAAALALVALAGCSSANRSDGRDEAQRQLPLAPLAATLTHSNVSPFDGQVAIQVKMELVGGDTVVTISHLMSWPVENTFLGFDHFYYGASASDHPIIEVRDEGCVEPVGGDGEACGWKVNYDGSQADGFGSFLSKKSDGPASHGATTQDLVFVVRGDVTFEPNNHNALFALHGRFSDDCSGWFSDGTATTLEPQDTCTPRPPERTCALSVDPDQLTLLAGGSATATVAVSETGNEPLAAVTLSVDPLSLPTGTTIGFVPNPVNPPGDSILTVQTLPSASTGDFPIQILGTGQDAAGRFECSVWLLLHITPPPPPPTGGCTCTP